MYFEKHKAIFAKHKELKSHVINQQHLSFPERPVPAMGQQDQMGPSGQAASLSKVKQDQAAHGVLGRFALLTGALPALLPSEGCTPVRKSSSRHHTHSSTGRYRRSSAPELTPPQQVKVLPKVT